MSNPGMSLKVTFSAGTSIDDAAVEAVALATKLGCWIDFDFNAVSCHVAPDSDPTELVAEWHVAGGASKSRYGRHQMAFAHPGGGRKAKP